MSSRCRQDRQGQQKLLPPKVKEIILAKCLPGTNIFRRSLCLCLCRCFCLHVCVCVCVCRGCSRAVADKLPANQGLPRQNSVLMTAKIEWHFGAVSSHCYPALYGLSVCECVCVCPCPCVCVCCVEFASDKTHASARVCVKMKTLSTQSSEESGSKYRTVVQRKQIITKFYTVWISFICIFNVFQMSLICKYLSLSSIREIFEKWNASTGNP